MPGVDLDLDLPSLSDPLSTIVSKLVTAVSTIEDDLADRVTAGELDIDTTLSMNGNPLTNVGGVRLLGGESDVVGTLYMDEELNIVTSAGVVQLTSNGALNASSLGAITGDFGGVNPAAVYYDDASGEFRFTESPGVYADLVCDDVKLIGANGSVRLSVNTGLSGAKQIDFLSFPSTGIGLLAYQASDSTIRDASTVTITADFTSSGAITTSGTVTAADYHLTTARVKWLQAGSAQVGNSGSGVTSWQMYDTGVGWTLQYGSSAAGCLLFPVPLDEGDTITEWHVRALKSTGATMTAGLYKQSAWGALTLVGSTSASSASGSTQITLEQTGLTELMGQNGYVIKVTCSALGNDVVYGAQVVYKRV